ncbi:MAG: hypothetical protein KJO38_12055 [Gammaproteobacteria bacterium]|nr:hypothetical protein [Gammaproteobacteria bacterium]
MVRQVAHKLITCILPKGIAPELLLALKEELDLASINIHTARGIGKITPLADRGIGEQAEKEVLTVVVTAAQADEVFEFIYDEARIDRPHGGIIFMHALLHASPYILPALPEES